MLAALWTYHVRRTRQCARTGGYFLPEIHIPGGPSGR